MTGGLIQLVARANQDLFLIHEPQITFFKVVYRRHTNFSLEPIQQNFITRPNFGKRVTCVLSRNGDLIRKIYVVIELPTIPKFVDARQNPDPIAKFAWVRRVGYAIIKTVEIEIGGELIDRQYGDWLNIWQELTLPDRKQIHRLLGDVKELTDFTNGKQSYQLMVPLQFWFNRIAGLALPIVSLQYNHIKLNLELNTLQNCSVVTPSNALALSDDFVNFIPNEYITQTIEGVTTIGQFIYFDILNRIMYLQQLTTQHFQSLSITDVTTIQTQQQQDSILYATDSNGTLVNSQYLITGVTSGFKAMPQINAVERIYVNNSINFNNISLNNCYLIVEYGFLDDDERIRFSKARHEYLIEQIFFNGQNTIDGLFQTFKLGFSQPCKELIWVTQLAASTTPNVNDTFNYTDSLIRDLDNNLTGSNIILNETLLFNGFERLTYRNSQYFSWLQPYQYHRHAPSPGINVYSFALHPEKHQPSGTVNMNRVDNIDLRVNVNANITFANTVYLRVYGVFNNILRIVNGTSGLVYSIDNSMF